MGLNRVLRRLVPSTSRLTYSLPFRLLVDAVDLPMRALFRELRVLPPNHQRIRVGVGNHLVLNQIGFLLGPRNFWMCAFAEGWCDRKSTILDIGCGCGRFAAQMRDLHFAGLRFEGRYFGIDLDEEMLAWCEANFDRERFAFIRASGQSRSYNQDADAHGAFRIPLEDASVDFVFSTSLFTHLLEQDLENYLSESQRVLKPGGYSSHSCFCLEHPPATIGDRHTFQHVFGNARVESLRQPEAAVAYSKSFLFEAARSAGFATSQLLVAKGGGQPLLVSRKGDDGASRAVASAARGRSDVTSLRQGGTDGEGEKNRY